MLNLRHISNFRYIAVHSFIQKDGGHSVFPSGTPVIKENLLFLVPQMRGHEVRSNAVYVGM